MAPTLRPRSNAYANENRDQRLKRVTTHHISSNWQKQRFRVSPSRGLRNRGVECYRNGLFQALVHIPKLLNYFDLHHELCQRVDCVACAFKNFTKAYWNDPSDNHLHRTLSLVQARMARSIAFQAVQWNWRIQNDSMEFFLHVLDTLRGTVHPTAQPIMQELFGFQMAETLYCPNRSCKAASTQIQLYNSLSINLEKPGPLKKMIRNHFARETRPGWVCSRCNQAVAEDDRVHGKRMHTSPDILVIDLVRFTPIGYTGSMQKNNAHVALKQELDLTPYTVNNHPSRYQLQSIVHHSGSLTGGHYIAACKGPEDDWRLLNDSVVTKTTFRSENTRTDDFTPYILFYARKGGRACAAFPEDHLPHLD